MTNTVQKRLDEFYGVGKPTSNHFLEKPHCDKHQTHNEGCLHCLDAAYRDPDKKPLNRDEMIALCHSIQEAEKAPNQTAQELVRQWDTFKKYSKKHMPDLKLALSFEVFMTWLEEQV